MVKVVATTSKQKEDLILNGGLKKDTLKKRSTNTASLLTFLKTKGFNGSIQDLIQLPVVEIEQHLVDFFSGLRTEQGELPKRNYFDSIKSSIKCVIQNESQSRLDISSQVQFSELHQVFKGFYKMLKQDGKADTSHHGEIPAHSLQQIQALFKGVYDTMIARGTPEYEEKLSTLPAEYHKNFHYLLQYAAVYIVITYDVRRGREGIADIKVDAFASADQEGLKFFHKSKGEASKNHARDDENLENGGIIPFLNDQHFNPGAIFEYYLTMLPKDCPYLFPRPRRQSKSFDISNPSAVLFENTKIGQNTVGEVMPLLTKLLQLPHATNHMLRSTGIRRLRRADYGDRQIAQVSGHRDLKSLENYDPGTPLQQKFQMAEVLTGCVPHQSAPTGPLSVVSNSTTSNDQTPTSEAKVSFPLNDEDPTSYLAMNEMDFEVQDWLPEELELPGATNLTRQIQEKNKGSIAVHSSSVKTCTENQGNLSADSGDTSGAMNVIAGQSMCITQLANQHVEMNKRLLDLLEKKL